MNEETIDKQLQDELERLKKVIEYFEEVQTTIQKIKKSNDTNSINLKTMIKSNFELEERMNQQIQDLTVRIEQFIHEINKISNHFSTQYKTIERFESYFQSMKSRLTVLEITKDEYKRTTKHMATQSLTLERFENKFQKISSRISEIESKSIVLEQKINNGDRIKSKWYKRFFGVK